MIHRLWPVAFLLIVGACDSGITALHPLPQGLEIDFTVEPDEVSQLGTFLASLRVSNMTSDTLRVVTGNGCLAIPRVTREGQPVLLVGSSWGCTAAVTTHVFPPGETRALEWEMKAGLLPQNIADVPGTPAPKGVYIIAAEFDTAARNDLGRKPIVEDPLLVIESGDASP